MFGRIDFMFQSMRIVCAPGIAAVKRICINRNFSFKKEWPEENYIQ
jgi:hypothetical protein